MTINLGVESRLLLAGFQESWPWLVAGLVVLALLLVLYGYERRLVSRGVGLLLLALRMLAAVALLSAMFEPVVEHERAESLRGRLIVGVDLSESMATVDPERTSAEQAELKRLFGLSEAAEQVGAVTRRELARRILAGRWLDELERAHDVEVFGFSRGLLAASRETLGAADQAEVIGDDGLATDWEAVLSQAVGSDQGGGDRPVVGVVLLSDGRSNGPVADSPAMPKLVAAKVPVFGVMIGSTDAPMDVAIAAINGPETVDKDQVARVDVTIKADGLPAGTEVPIRLERAGQPAMVQTVRAQVGGGRPSTSFRVLLDEPGEVALSVKVGPIEGDVRPENDQKVIRVIVADDKARVLLVDAEPRWEFQYLRNLLVRDPRVTLEVVVLNQPRLGDRGASAAGFYQQALPAVPEAASADPLGGFDVVILGDLKDDDLTARDWERLSWYVAERGGTLVISAGPRGWSSAGSIGPSASRALLPVQDARLLPVDQRSIDASRPNLPAGRALLPTPAATAAGSWPMLRLAEDAAASQRRWASLPRQPWVLGGRVKATATALAVARVVESGEEALPLAAEPALEDDTVAMAAMPYGLGKVLWIGADGTWRWRFGIGDAIHHRFWGQVVQWGVKGKLMAGNRLVQFGADPPRVTEGEPARVRARFTEAAEGLKEGTIVAARVRRVPEGADDQEKNGSESEAQAVVRLLPSVDQPRGFEAELPRLPPGRYAVTLEVPELAEAFEAEGEPPEATLEVEARETSELVELAASGDELSRLAGATGGALLRDVEIDALPGLLQKRKVVRTRVESSRLWDRPEALLFFVGLLTVEWLVRKRAGLP